MSYRPITDFWFLARAKLLGGRKYYGAYLGGFPERARVLLGAPIDQPVLHVCGGMARYYPYRGGFGPQDKTLDLNPETEPDFLQDARHALPDGVSCTECPDHAGYQDWVYPATCDTCYKVHARSGETPGVMSRWAGILIDPPYSEGDAEHYPPGAANYPSPNLLVRNALDVLPVGGKVGIIHYVLPAHPKATSKFVAVAGVQCGHNNRIRCFSVFERTA